ncbi:MAG: X2-like carbohydrate binding domain-containing protein [Lachnospiraceae bacterium]|nr:X2-like carbohydrate binding domain-containing protein [Lachnospiraceae bacterium]
MKKRVKAYMVFVICLIEILTLMPSTVYAQQGNSVTLTVRACEYTECEGDMDYVYIDRPEWSATFTADDPGAVLDTNTTGGYTGIQMDYIGAYEMTYTLEEGYNRFCTVHLAGKLSAEPISGMLTVPVPAGCDASSAKYSLYTEDESYNPSTTPFVAVSSYTENTITIPYQSVNGISDYILVEYVATEAVSYHVVDGINSTWTADSADGLSVRADGVLEKFQSVKVDGAVVDASNYTATSGSTIITFKKEYLSTLAAGTHNITIVFTDGEASTSVTITAVAAEQPSTVQQPAAQTPVVQPVQTTAQKDAVPKTGESDAVMGWMILSLCSFVGMISLYGFRKKQ